MTVSRGWCAWHRGLADDVRLIRVHDEGTASKSTVLSTLQAYDDALKESVDGATGEAP